MLIGAELKKMEKTKMSELYNRKEIIFLYSVRDTNPNGDPDDENRPRTDDENRIIVSDVRLKRTIRDYLLTKDKESVLIKQVINDNNEILNISDLITDKLGNNISRQKIQREIPKLFIDVRLFGLTAAVKGAQTSITGPVQFSIGHSLNKPRIYTHTITSTISAASKAGGAMGNFHILDYAMIAFEGVICPHLAKISQMNDSDLNKLYCGLWMGTKILHSRSKMNHIPKLLIVIVSKNSDFLIGGLAYLLSMNDESKEDVVNFTSFIDKILEYEDKIEKIEYIVDNDLKCIYKDKEFLFKDLIDKKLTNITSEELQIGDC